MNENDLSKISKDNLEKGLSTQEVKTRAEIYGKNELPEKKNRHWLLIFLDQFKDFMNLLLLFAVLISFIVILVELSQNNWAFSRELVIAFVEPFIILLVIFLNSLIGTVQVIKSNQIVRSLKKMNIIKSKVIRDGQLINIDSSELVPGDLIILEAGDKIPADSILIESSQFNVNESILTGESLAVEKIANLDFEKLEEKNKIFSSCSVTNGYAKAIVIKIGSQTEVGKISSLLDEQNKLQSPLQIKLHKLGKLFGFLGISLFLITFFIQIALANFASQKEIYINSLIVAISLSVAAIPEGLAAFTTIIISLGVKRMSKQNALVKSLLAVEALGSTSVICTDKTGTLTKNEMELVDVYNIKENKFFSTQKDFKSFSSLIHYASLCTTAQVKIGENNSIEEVGDPTETAIIKFALKNNLAKSDLEKDFVLVNKIPFDSSRKMMTMIFKYQNKFIAITKGASEEILKRSLKVDKEPILKINQDWSRKTYRVLALAIKEIDSNLAYQENLESEQIEKDFSLLGLLAIVDPPREQVKDAIFEVKNAGIKTVMITGDHPETAVAIAKEIGLWSEGDKYLTGQELAQMPHEKLRENIQNYSVYARVKPEDKLNIIRAWQDHDQVVSMTGDGVNDAPALKASDIGFAMGITGTDVSKEASDVILLDDNYTTIKNSVENGRKIYFKIRKVIENLLITSVAEILAVFFGIIIYSLIFKYHQGFFEKEVYIFGATQLLWINLVTHSFPAIAIGLVENDLNLMVNRPRYKHESIFANKLGWRIFIQGFILAFLCLLVYGLAANYYINNVSSASPKEIVSFASTASFVTLGLSSSINAINLLSNKSILRLNLKQNWVVVLAISFSSILILLVSLVPQLAEFFKMNTRFVEMSLILWISIALAFVPTLLIEIHKAFVKFFVKEKKVDKIISFEMIKGKKSRF
ncbi:cation-translocating P-type ATPase [Mycoplasmopsis pulmonis]|uniref:cation-translocating P-type ATPase n=1 Tax=Mycoplasmopsis pulmonis TaxID=2107 RepID=UPI001004D7A6|nr:cation-transporting P-type ATPase [Mycoplasmopsis pulmonis]VEU67920.1 Calcium-transporting ATPase [Mycoplasmopsis pulmonis]